MAFEPVEKTPMDALKKLLGMHPSNMTDMGGQSSTALDETVDPRLKSFEPSEQDLIDQQEERIAAQGAQNRGRSGGVIVEPSRDALRDSAMGKVKSLLGMTDIKHKNDMEEAALKEAGLNRRAELSHQDSARPYFTPLQTAEGIQSFDTRTGKVAGRLGDYKPGETAQDVLTNAQGVQKDIERVRNFFRPEFVGPIAGRFGSVEQALLGGNPEMTDLYQTAQRLHNTIVYLRTGKQMNESEAARILAELPTKNLKPDVFIGRLNNMANYFDEWMQNRSKLAFGRTTAGDVDKMTGTNMGGPATAPAAAQAAPGRVRQYNPATKRVE